MPAGRPHRVRRPPRLPVAFLALMVALAAASIVTGVVDVLLPVFVPGLETFGVLNALVAEFGPGYLFLHVLLHNLGLACLVPGAGLLAAKYEPDKRNRELAAMILLGAVVLSLFVAFEYIVQARERFNLAFVIPLLALEGAGVLLLAWRGYRVVRVFRPTPRIGWSLVQPARELAPWFGASLVILAVGAVAETAFLFGAFA